MLRRIVALLLWTYFAWYLGALVAATSGLPSVIGPGAAISMVLIAVVDWRRTLRGTWRAEPQTPRA